MVKLRVLPKVIELVSSKTEPESLCLQYQQSSFHWMLLFGYMLEFLKLREKGKLVGNSAKAIMNKPKPYLVNTYVWLDGL